MPIQWIYFPSPERWVSQHGSSGGAVADQNGDLTGLIVTATDAPDTASRDLRAIRPPTSCVTRLRAGISLSAYLSGNILDEAAVFNAGTAPTLTQELENVLNQ